MVIDNYAAAVRTVKTALSHAEQAKVWFSTTDFARGYDQATRDLARDFAEILEAADPTFDRTRFLVDSGVVAEEVPS